MNSQIAQMEAIDLIFKKRGNVFRLMTMICVIGGWLAILYFYFYLCALPIKLYNVYHTISSW
jgi:hypothetical protein